MGGRTIGDFLKRMGSDRTFRGRILAAGRDGFEAALHEEGYVFTPAELRGHLPQARTGVQAGQFMLRGKDKARLICMTLRPCDER